SQGESLHNWLLTRATCHRFCELHSQCSLSRDYVEKYFRAVSLISKPFDGSRIVADVRGFRHQGPDSIRERAQVGEDPSSLGRPGVSEPGQLFSECLPIRVRCGGTASSIST